jgi:hypothetical protein
MLPGKMDEVKPLRTSPVGQLIAESEADGRKK